MFCSQNLHAENNEWNIYKNFDYWKYPTIAITRNTSLEGHRVRTEITCHGSYLGIKLIHSFPNDFMTIPNRAIVMELNGKKYNFYGNGVFKEQDPVYYSRKEMAWQERDRDDLFDRSFFTSLLNSDDDQSFTLYGSALSTDDYNNLTKRDYDLLYDKEWRIENAEILSKSKFFSVKVTMKNYKKSHDELLTYCHTPFKTYED
tara:strand:+ start:324 stop:929 length:606 start_codon:yes stop_codon:yes gene_type:complete